MAVRASSHQIGGSLLEKLLNWDAGGGGRVAIECGQGHRAHFVEYRDKQLVTAYPRFWSNEPTITVNSAKRG